jgi:hypothetical protein
MRTKKPLLTFPESKHAYWFFMVASFHHPDGSSCPSREKFGRHRCVRRTRSIVSAGLTKAISSLCHSYLDHSSISLAPTTHVPDDESVSSRPHSVAKWAIAPIETELAEPYTAVWSSRSRINHRPTAILKQRTFVTGLGTTIRAYG